MSVEQGKTNKCKEIYLAVSIKQLSTIKISKKKKKKTTFHIPIKTANEIQWTLLKKKNLLQQNSSPLVPHKIYFLSHQMQYINVLPTMTNSFLKSIKVYSSKRVITGSSSCDLWNKALVPAKPTLIYLK